jgi:hypothetical protein
MITDEIFKALGYLLIAGIVSTIYHEAQHYTEGGKLKMVLWKGFLWCAGIAFFASLILGSATCEQKSDPVYGGCEEYADDGYEPTTQQRIANFAYLMTLFYIPIVFGALKESKKSH